jgi:hypothetical protein
MRARAHGTLAPPVASFAKGHADLRRIRTHEEYTKQTTVAPLCAIEHLRFEWITLESALILTPAARRASGRVFGS